MIPASDAGAQTFTTLRNFTFSTGGNPSAGLSLSGDTLYGTTPVGGSLSAGTIFKINRDGTGFTNFYNFIGGTNGGSASGGVILSGSTLYGAGNTVFAINTNGTGFTNLHVFPATVYDSNHDVQTNSDGVSPWGGLLLSGNTLYGTARAGGILGGGTVFKINTNGTGFTVLRSFPQLDTFSITNDGAWPRGTMILSGNTLYGTTQFGGPYRYLVENAHAGTVFAINTDGTDFRVLHGFNGATEGVHPWGGVVLLGDTLYGTTSSGGSLGAGTVFKVNTNGTAFTNLHNFTGHSGWDGYSPYAGLIGSGSTLYGTTFIGGVPENGTVFAINTDGTGFTNLHVFTATPPTEVNSDGMRPYAGLVLAGNVLFGTAQMLF